MAFDDELAGRIRAALSFIEGVTEKRMFGGLGFMVNGHMVAAASSSGGLMLRVDRAAWRDLVDGTAARPFRMNDRDTVGWLYLEPDTVDDDAELARWLRLGLDHVATLPPK